MKNPCINCGACCAHFRVQFYWREPVPQPMFEELDSRYRCMKGTNDKHHPKCAGLKGRIGRDACCSMYEQRPTPCRDFTASYADGRRNVRCDEARARHGLKPLRPEDYCEDSDYGNLTGDRTGTDSPSFDGGT